MKQLFDTLLITGCGGDIGLTLGAIAAKSGVAGRVIGCDIHGDHPGSVIFDACEIVPRADDAGYLASLQRLADRHDVDAIVPMSEAEIACLANAGSLTSFGGRPVIAANRDAVEVCLDKLETSRMLERAGLPVPWTFAAEERLPLAYPCIFKPRRGQGGKGLRRIEDADAARKIGDARGYIWQELILPDEPEYTCGLYRTADKETRTLILKRKLQGGVTHSAEVVADDAIDALLHSIAEALDLAGSINVQLRVDNEGPKVFEINPRFSSTVGFRDRLGFQDFIWMLGESRNVAVPAYNPPKVGTRLYRGISSFVIPPA